MNTKSKLESQLEGSNLISNNSIGSGNKGINKCGFSASLNGEQKIEMFKLVNHKEQTIISTYKEPTTQVQIN